MSQTKNAINFRRADAYIGTDDPPPLSWGPFGVSVAVEGGSRSVGRQHTRDGDYPIEKYGKRDGLSVTVRYVYTQVDAEFHNICLGIYDTEGGAVNFKWIPDGEAQLGLGYIITGGGMTDFMYPQGAADAADIVPGEVKISTPRIIEYQVT